MKRINATPDEIVEAIMKVVYPTHIRRLISETSIKLEESSIRTALSTLPTTDEREVLISWETYRLYNMADAYSKGLSTANVIDRYLSEKHKNETK